MVVIAALKITVVSYAEEAAHEAFFFRSACYCGQHEVLEVIEHSRPSRAP